MDPESRDFAAPGAGTQSRREHTLIPVRIWAPSSLTLNSSYCFHKCMALVHAEPLPRAFHQEM